MQREIGSNFDLSTEFLYSHSTKTALNFSGMDFDDRILLSTGRSAELFVLDDIAKKRKDFNKIAIIPPFTCVTVIEPLVKRGYEIFSYDVDENLNIDLGAFENLIKQTHASVVLLHRYFGFDTLKGIKPVIKKIQSEGVAFIEDRTQCLYSSHESLECDYVIGSLRKWAALPDGGIALSRNGQFRGIPEKHDARLEELKLAASQLKYDYLHKGEGEKKTYLDMYREAEQTLQKQDEYFLIAPSSLRIQESLDIEGLKEKRRRNYDALYKNLIEQPFLRIITPSLSECDVPLYLTVSTRYRGELQAYLRDKDIYAPIVWPKSELSPRICEAAQNIYDTVLSLPIDQRYDTDDMERMSSEVVNFGKTLTVGLLRK